MIGVRLTLLLFSIVLVLSGRLAVTADSVETLVDEARSYLEKGELKSAAIQLQNALKQNPDNAEARFLLGELFLRVGYVGAAEKQLLYAKKLGLESQDWRLPLARAYLIQKKYQEVLQDISMAPGDSPETRSSLLTMAGIAEIGLEKNAEGRKKIEMALKLSSDNADALLGAAQLALLNSNYAKALVQVDKAIASDPERIDAWVMKGEVHRLQREYDKALDIYQQILDSHPGSLLARIGRAQIFMGRGKWDEALADAGRVAWVGISYPYVNYLGAQALFQKQDYPAALEALQRVLRVLPNHMPSFLLFGQVYHAQGNLTQAENFLTRFVTAQPENIQGAKLLATVKMKLGRAQEAVQVLEAALAYAQEDAQLLALLGSAYLQAGDYTKGTTYLEKAIKQAPGVAENHTLLALSQLALGQMNKAAVELERAIGLGHAQALDWLAKAQERNPNSLGVGLLLVRQYLKRGDYASALTAARRLHSSHRGHPAAVQALAQAQLYHGDIEEVVETIQQFIEMQPRDPQGWHLLAMARLRAGNPEAAARAWDKALALQDDYLPVLELKARYELQEKHYPEALAGARLIQAKHPTQAAGFQLEGDIHRARQDFAKAISAYQSAYGRAPSADLTLLLSDTQWLAGDQEVAIQTIEQWIMNNPTDIRVRGQLALYLIMLKRPAAAIEQYERVLGHQPGNITALNNLAWLYHEAGDPRALTLAERAVELAPQQPNFADTLGWILLQQGQLERALPVLEQAVSQAPESPSIRYHLAVAYAKAERKQEARQELETLLNSGKRFSDMEKAQALLDSLE